MRWPFAVALVAVLVGVGAMFATPHIKTRWQAWQDARQERQWAAEFKRAQPAVDALARMPLPDGVENCPGVPRDALTKTHMVCWRGTTEVEPATLALATNLRGIGAENVSPRCVRKNGAAAILRIMCEVSAEVEGQTVFVSVSPQIDKVGDAYNAHGVAISGDVGPAEDVFSILGTRATPLPIPGG
jgi:hypothetical protein